MRGDEDLVVQSFCTFLAEEGWQVTKVGSKHADEADVYAARPDGRRLIVEAKGAGEYIGTDVDVAYGQLLRRMVDDPAVRYAVVVRDDARSVRAVLRVPGAIRQRLAIDLYAVSAAGDVRALP